MWKCRYPFIWKHRFLIDLDHFLWLNHAAVKFMHYHRTCEIRFMFFMPFPTKHKFFFKFTLQSLFFYESFLRLHLIEKNLWYFELAYQEYIFHRYRHNFIQSFNWHHSNPVKILILQSFIYMHFSFDI